MTKIQLIDPQTGYIELSENVAVPLTFEIANIKNISSKKAPYSKSIVVPGSKNNNQIFNQIYDINSVTNEFNINKLQKINIIGKNGEILFENGLMQLISIDKINENFTLNNDNIKYTVLIKDTTGDFYTNMSDKKLEDIKLLSNNHEYTLPNVVASWSHTQADGYKYILPYISPLGQPTDNEYMLTELKPGIYAKTYWDAIFDSNGYTYTWPSMLSDDIRFDKLIIPYNGDIPKLSNEAIESNKVLIRDVNLSETFDTSTTSTMVNPFAFDEELLLTIEELDNENLYNNTTGIFQPNYNAQTPGGIVFEFEVEYTLYLENLNAYNVTIQNVPGHTNNRFSLNMGVFNLTQNTDFRTQLDEIVISTTPTYTPGLNVIKTNTQTVSVLVNNVNAFNNLGMFISFEGLTNNPTLSKWVNASTFIDTTGMQWKVDIDNIRVTIKESITNAAAFGTTIVLNDYIPKNILQRDFVKSICNLFNLYIYQDRTNPTNLIINTRDEFYNNGVVKDLTHLLANDSNQVLEFLPDVTAKALKLTYKEDKDTANSGYLANVGEVYGEFEYIFDSEHIKNKEKLEVIFSPTPILKTTFDAVLPFLQENGGAPKNNIRILYDGGMLPCNEYKIYNVWTSFTTFTEYPFISHFDKPVNAEYDLNYGTCDYYFYDNFGETPSNNLFNKFWTNTFNTINNSNMLTAYFKLNDNFISNLKLNDIIYLKQYNSYFFINSIIDYNTNSKQLTKVELISFDTDIKIRPNRTIATPISNGNPILNGVNIRAKDRFIPLNIDLTSVSNIIGFNNYITELGSNANVIGNNNTVNAANVTILNSNDNNINVPNTIINSLSTINAIEIDYLSLKDLKDTNQLVPGFTYFITDKNIYVTAGTENTFNPEAIRNMRIVKPEYYVEGGSYKGIWYPSMSVSIFNLCVWGARVWFNLSGLVGTAIDEFTLSADWNMFDISDDVYYKWKTFKIIYEFDNDFIRSQTDDRNNTVKQNFNNNYYSVCDWGLEYYNIHNNTMIAFLNNKLTTSTGIVDNVDLGIIHNNRCSAIAGNIFNDKGSIINNSNNGSISFNTIKSTSLPFGINSNSNNGSINYNSNNGSINNNSNNGSINNNSNDGNINSNTNDGAIIANTNIGSIENNSNIGAIVGNTHRGRILNNSNNGDITLNSNIVNIDNNSNDGRIFRNSNNGVINVNSNDGNIEINSNDGEISLNSNSGGIFKNSNNGGILFNSNNGDIIYNINNGEIKENTSDVGTTFDIESNQNNGYISSNNSTASINISHNINNGDIGIDGTPTNRAVSISDAIVNK